MTTDSSFISLHIVKEAVGKKRPYGDWEPTGKIIHMRPAEIVTIMALGEEYYEVRLHDGRIILVAIDHDTLHETILGGHQLSLSVGTVGQGGDEQTVLEAIDMGMRQWQKTYADGDPDLFEPYRLTYSSLETAYHSACELRAAERLLPYSWGAFRSKVEKPIRLGYAEAEPSDYRDGELDLSQVRLSRMGIGRLKSKRLH